MAAVDVYNVQVHGNPSSFTAPLQFEIAYEVREALTDDVEWKVVYVGSAEDEAYDQELDSALVPADTPGRFQFVLEVDAPDPQRIPSQDIVGVTIILLTCSYHGREFIRVGYYVNNEYTDPELMESPPAVAEVSKIVRNIVGDQPRVTKFQHNFDFSDRGMVDAVENGEDKQLSRSKLMEDARNAHQHRREQGQR